MINRALLGVYLADKEVNEQINVKKLLDKFYIHVMDQHSFFFGMV